MIKVVGINPQYPSINGEIFDTYNIDPNICYVPDPDHLWKVGDWALPVLTVHNEHKGELLVPFEIEGIGESHTFEDCSDYHVEKILRNVEFTQWWTAETCVPITRVDDSYDINGTIISAEEFRTRYGCDPIPAKTDNFVYNKVADLINEKIDKSIYEGFLDPNVFNVPIKFIPPNPSRPCAENLVYPTMRNGSKPSDYAGIHDGLFDWLGDCDTFEAAIKGLEEGLQNMDSKNYGREIDLTEELILEFSDKVESRAEQPPDDPTEWPTPEDEVKYCGIWARSCATGLEHIHKITPYDLSTHYKGAADFEGHVKKYELEQIESTGTQIIPPKSNYDPYGLKREYGHSTGWD